MSLQDALERGLGPVLDHLRKGGREEGGKD